MEMAHLNCRLEKTLLRPKLVRVDESFENLRDFAISHVFSWDFEPGSISDKGQQEISLASLTSRSNAWKV